MQETSRLRRAFIAATFTAGFFAAAGSTAEANFALGGQCHGEKCWAYIMLEDPTGSEYKIDLPAADKDLKGFQTEAIAILREFVTARGAKFDTLEDQSAAGLKYMLDRVADQGQMPLDDLKKKIGLSERAYKDISYRAYRAEVMRDRAFLSQAARVTAPRHVGMSMDSNDETIKNANDALAKAKAAYPNEPLFQIPPLTADDLLAVRRNAALVLTTAALRLFKEIDAGYANEKSLDQERIQSIIDNIVSHLYERPENEWRYSKGEKYNSELPAMFDRALTMNGCRDACKADFYKRVIRIHNYYDRVKPIALPAAQPAPQPPPAATTPLPPKP